MAGTEEAPRRALGALAARFGVACDDGQLDRLLAFARLLLTWSARINLTAAESIDELVAEHFPDAFALAARLSAPARAIDVGSGGGLPALPLAVLCPALELDLCEPIAKKGAFLRTAIRELGLGDRVRLRATRGEQLAETDGGRYDVALSRATFRPAAWIALARRLARPGGRIFALTAANDVPPGLRGDVYLDGRRALVEVANAPAGPDAPRGTALSGPADVPRGTSAAARRRRRGEV
jgi:16S rRNA (guanine527-N7)-methyltransferase